MIQDSLNLVYGLLMNQISFRLRKQLKYFHSLFFGTKLFLKITHSFTMKHLRRVFNLYCICTINEFVFIVKHFTATSKLHQKNVKMHRLLCFAIATADKGYQLVLEGKNLIKVTGIGKEKKHKILVRKYTRDLLVFDGFFVSDDYYSIVKNIIDQNTNIESIIDAGANIGCATILLNSYFPNARIVCVEPEASNAEILYKNIQLNQLEALVSIEQKALWNVDTALELQQIDYSHDGFHVMNGLSHGSVDVVNTITSEQIMMKYNMPRVNIFKIDVEGAEKTLFEDEQCKESFIPKTDNIIMEVHPAYISTADIINCLKSYRFNAEKISIEGQPIAVVAQRLLQLG